MMKVWLEAKKVSLVIQDPQQAVLEEQYPNAAYNEDLSRQ
tara:strand:- start:219 stop:338 length:120 start_codon:yes stop_codon:yes gene_type:complete